MDPVGPWSAYASYNRLAGVQPGTGGGELHHHLATTGATGAQPTTTAQILPGSFLSPPPVGYETVFSPLFHHAGAKPAAHYVTQVTQHRAQALAQAQAAASKQTGEGEYHQAQAFFEQGANAWQQNSPFGILPHESVVSTTPGKTAAYENFNAHFAAAQSLNHLNSQLAAANVKSAVTRAQSPQVTTASSKPTTANSSTFFQVTTFAAGSDASAQNNKTFPSSNASNLQQSCIVSSATNTSASKEYRIPQTSPRTVYLNSPNLPRTVEKPFVAPTKQPPAPLQIQTKAQTKIYPELNQSDRRSTEENQSQSSPISFSIMDAPGRMNYVGSNSSAKRSQFQHANYRHYQPGTNPEADFQRPKNNADYNTNGPDCNNVVVPRRPSPLQANSQASPLGHVPSPAYPMYNSPMNSISSPQQNSSNQVTPPSPLDVSVPRPNSQTSVAYPSVITRALNAEKNFTADRYDRTSSQNNQNCWDDSRQRKYQAQTSQNSYGNSEIVPAGNQQRIGVPERQQAYFDAGHQVTLQDLSSCRGDPMSIVKNLQQQQSCQVQQSEVKQEVKVATKRRKSNDKNNTPVPAEMTGTAMEYFSGRIPPPAHSSGANQQQQNGGYFDFDRWNLPPPTSKIFGSQTIHQQHQGLMVPHPHPHHPPPPLPYFPPFHLTTHPPEFPSSVELAPISTYGEQAPQQPAAATPQFVQQQQQQQQEEQPKVVVPNIEEELNFLSEGTTRAAAPAGPRPPHLAPLIKSDKPMGPGVGFMNSYLKFLQGERDSSPPPPVRGGRKTTWSRQTKPLQQPDVKPDSNGIKAVPPPPPPAPITRLSQGDPQDDPRYFPLPKERKRRSFDSSDDGFSSDDDLFNAKLGPPPKSDIGKEKSSRKGRPAKATGNAERKRSKQAQQNREHFNSSGAISTDNLPRRETSKRAAKEKINMKQLMAKQGDDDLEEPGEFVDSDSDPAWTPLAKEEEGEELTSSKKSRRGRPSNSKKKKNLITAAAQGAGIQDIDGYSSDSLSSHSRKSKSGSRQQKQSVPPTLEDNIAAAVALQNNTPPVTLADDGPFKPGEFVVIKSELSQEWPAIWRVDGKTLLQKYEPFEQNGQTLYRNISTYTSWTPESKKQYIPVPVRFKAQSQLETIVEFLRSEILIVDHDFIDKVMKESEVFQDNFEVYIQTLISQALDSNFLTEIFQEKDEYFLSNVKTIDDITDSKKQKLLVLLRWPKPVQAAVTTWPCFNVIREVSAVDMQSKSCATCLTLGVSVRVLMYGQPYNSTTLEGCQPDPQAVNEKDFLMCRICANRVELFNKITHQKYLMYIECAKRVAEKRTTESHKDTTCILNELLADESWLNQLFLDVRSSWAEVDSLEHSFKMKNANKVSVP